MAILTVSCLREENAIDIPAWNGNNTAVWGLYLRAAFRKAKRSWTLYKERICSKEEQTFSPFRKDLFPVGSQNKIERVGTISCRSL